MNVIKQQNQEIAASSTSNNLVIIPEDFKPVSEGEETNALGVVREHQVDFSVAHTLSQFCRTASQLSRSSPVSTPVTQKPLSNRPSRNTKSSSSLIRNSFSSPSNTMGSDSKVHWSNDAAHHLLDSVEKYRNQYEAKGGALFWVNVTNAFCAQSATAYANFTKQNIITKWKNLRRDVRYFQEHPEKFTRQADVLIRTQKLMQSMGLNISTPSSASHHHQSNSGGNYTHHYRTSGGGRSSAADKFGSTKSSFASAKVGKIMMSKKSARKSAINGRSAAAPVPIAPYPAPKLSGIQQSSGNTMATKPSSFANNSVVLPTTSTQNSSTTSSTASQLVQHLMATTGNTPSAVVVESASTPPPSSSHSHNLYQVVSSALNSNNSLQGSSSNVANSRTTNTCVVSQATLQQLIASMATSCNGISSATTTISAASDNIPSISGINALLGIQNGAQLDSATPVANLTDILDEIIRLHEAENGRLHEIAQHFSLFAQQSSSRLQLLRHFRNLYDSNQHLHSTRVVGDTVSALSAAGGSGECPDDDYDRNGIASAGGGSSD